jgi:hypothetical protein
MIDMLEEAFNIRFYYTSETAILYSDREVICTLARTSLWSVTVTKFMKVLLEDRTQ